MGMAAGSSPDQSKGGSICAPTRSRIGLALIMEGLLEWYFKTPNQREQCHRPKRYDDLVALAECLGQGFDHIRVDMYDADELWVGELTVYPLGGLTSFTPDEADKIVGSYWNLHRPARRALGAVLFRWWHV
jgi:hypothetical protein